MQMSHHTSTLHQHKDHKIPNLYWRSVSIDTLRANERYVALPPVGLLATTEDPISHRCASGSSTKPHLDSLQRYSVAPTVSFRAYDNPCRSCQATAAAIAKCHARRFIQYPADPSDSALCRQLQRVAWVLYMHVCIHDWPQPYPAAWLNQQSAQHISLHRHCCASLMLCGSVLFQLRASGVCSVV